MGKKRSRDTLVSSVTVGDGVASSRFTNRMSARDCSRTGTAIREIAASRGEEVPVFNLARSSIRSREAELTQEAERLIGNLMENMWMAYDTLEEENESSRTITLIGDGYTPGNAFRCCSRYRLGIGVACSTSASGLFTVADKKKAQVC